MMAMLFCCLLFHRDIHKTHHLRNARHQNKTGLLKYQKDISATRLSQGDPGGFPPHPREWFSIIVYLVTAVC